jgi:hypothetical protein
MWSMFVFFLWVMVVWLVIMLMVDNFRRQDHSGWAKAGWTLILIFLPLLGAIIYMVVRPKGEEAYEAFVTDADVGYPAPSQR